LTVRRLGSCIIGQVCVTPLILVFKGVADTHNNWRKAHGNFSFRIFSYLRCLKGAHLHCGQRRAHGGGQPGSQHETRWHRNDWARLRPKRFRATRRLRAHQPSTCGAPQRLRLLTAARTAALRNVIDQIGGQGAAEYHPNRKGVDREGGRAQCRARPVTGARSHCG